MSGQEWVVGFLLSTDGENVVLIRKNRPPWQKDRLNGVGGKVEQRETPGQAMSREFLEEAGVAIPSAIQLSDGQWTWGWRHFLSLTWEEGVVHFFRCFSSAGVLAACRTVTDESIERHRICTLNQPGPGLAFITPNLLWLVPLAAHRHDDYDVVLVTETGTTLRKVGRAGEG